MKLLNIEQQPQSSPWVVSLDDPAATDLALVGGKGANLARLRAAGIAVPAGFCVSTRAFFDFVQAAPDFTAMQAALDGPKTTAEQALSADEDKDGDDDNDENANTNTNATSSLRQRAQDLRAHLEAQTLPKAMQENIVKAWRALENPACAVRSSATAEDLPEASFAGQQDTYLNVRTEAELLDKVRACWASLFTERAIVYRQQNHIAHADVALAVVVQEMVDADRSGILFTADPLTGHRGQLSIDAGWGLGEALVSGTVSADLYRVDKASGALLEFKPGQQKHAIVSQKSGGTKNKKLDQDKVGARVLDDSQLNQLLEVGRRIEALYASPQDIEWCFVDDNLKIVQSRPITTLFPLASPQPDQPGLELLLSINHLQVMTDAMPPMAHDVIAMALPLGRGLKEQRRSPWLRSAGGRLYVNVAPALRRAPMRALLLRFLQIADSLAGAALKQVVSRPVFKRGPKISIIGLLSFMLPMQAKTLSWLLWRNVDPYLDDLGQRQHREITAMRARIQAGRGIAQRLSLAQSELFLLFVELLRIPPALIAGMLGLHLGAKLAGATDSDLQVLQRGVVGNVTTDMDLEVGDMADALRPYPQVCQALIQGETDLDKLQALAGGDALRKNLDDFLMRYGMRGPSEFDISRPRWRENPNSLLTTLAGNLRRAQAGTHRQGHEALQQQAEASVARLIAQARRGLLGPLRAALVRRLLHVGRVLIGVREHPKFYLMRVMGLLRELVVEAGLRLQARGSLLRPDDVWFVYFDELVGALKNESVDLRALVKLRRQDFARWQKMTAPRVMTSEGEIPQVSYARGDQPEDALLGAGVSAGVIEGVARVVRDPSCEILRPGEILVAPFTDPGWTPLFINAAGLVMEVGGMMTHGSVVAREYGIPAVVGVLQATTLIKTGQRLRVDGAAGWVQILDEEKA